MLGSRLGEGAASWRTHEANELVWAVTTFALALAAPARAKMWEAGIDFLTQRPLDEGSLFGHSLAMRVPDQDTGVGLQDDGSVQLCFGASTGVNTVKPFQAFGEKAGFKIAPPNDAGGFGRALAIADFDGDGWGDLAVGAPLEAVSNVSGAGAVQVLFGVLFADGFTSGTTRNRSAVVSP